MHCGLRRRAARLLAAALVVLAVPLASQDFPADPPPPPPTPAPATPPPAVTDPDPARQPLAIPPPSVPAEAEAEAEAEAVPLPLPLPDLANPPPPNPPAPASADAVDADVDVPAGEGVVDAPPPVVPQDADTGAADQALSAPAPAASAPAAVSDPRAVPAAGTVAAGSTATPAAEASAAAAAGDVAETEGQRPADAPDQVGPPVPDPDTNEFGASPIALLDDRIAPGTRRRLRWTTGQSFSGTVMETPVIVVHGARPGPRLCLTAGVHGDELNGVEVVRRVAYALEPDDIAGTVIAVPIVNLLGFSRGTRYLPDRRDLNRFFPGSRGGSSASRIAYSFFSSVVDHCDALVDFHTGSFDRANLPQVRGDLRNPAVVEFTRGFGATAVLHSPGAPGMLRHAASRRGIPAVTFEIGGPLRLQPAEIEHGVQAIQSLMHQMRMVDSRRRWTEPQAVFYESRWVRVDQGGMLFSDKALGDRVRGGERLGTVIDPVSNRTADVVAPEPGRIIGMALNQLVLPGFAAYHIGVAASEEQVVIDAAQEAAPDDERFLEYDQLDAEGARPRGDDGADPEPADGEEALGGEDLEDG